MDAKKSILDKCLLSCLTQLESFEEVSGVDFQPSEGCYPAEISAWEAKNCPYLLPADFKAFYSLFNGVKLSYKVDIGGRQVPIGEIRLNKLDAVVRIALEGTFPTMTWLRTGPDACARSGESNGSSFESCSLDFKASGAFSIDSSPEIGEVVLLYRSPDQGSVTSKSYSNPIHGADSRVRTTTSPYEDPEVWFQDISARWHFVSPTFTNFLRLTVTHFGIFGWQFAYTPEGLPADTIHWMGLLCKEVRLHSLSSLSLCLFPLVTYSLPLPPTLENLCRFGVILSISLYLLLTESSFGSIIN